MANWSLPSISDLYADVISLFKARDVDLAKGLDPAKVTVTNPEADFIRWNSASSMWEKYSGTAWGVLTATYSINVDQVDGCHAGTAANNVLKLDGSGLVPAGNLPATANALEVLASFGIIVKSAAGTITPRSLAVGAGLGVSNADGVAGNPTVSISDTLLAALVSLVTDANQGLYFTAADTPATYTLTAAGRALLDDADASAQLTTLGVSAFIKTLLDDADAAAALGTLGAVAKAGDAFTGGMKEKKVAMAANDIDINTGNYFTKTLTGNTTFTVSNTPATGTVASFILDLTNGGAYTITWWSGMKWEGGTAPQLTSSGRDVLAFFTHDGGTTWSGFLLGKDIK